MCVTALTRTGLNCSCCQETHNPMGTHLEFKNVDVPVCVFYISGGLTEGTVTGHNMAG